MNRRDFLKAMIAVPLVVKTLSIAEVFGSLTPSMISHEIGYDIASDYTWLRISTIMPDEKEWHDLLHVSGKHDVQSMLDIHEMHLTAF